MRIFQRITSLWIALLLLIVPEALAAPQIDRDQTGSITVQIVCKGEAVSGGSITIFRVASLDEALRFQPVEEFADVKVDLNEKLSAAKIRTLAEFAEARKVKGQTVSIGSDGRAGFSDLKTGLYLVMQQEESEGYLPIKPFVVSIPMVINEQCHYDVDASPKTETSSVATDPTDPTEPSKPSVPEPPGLPQTGQTNWPVPVLTIMGLILLLTGAVLCFGKGRRGHEA